MDDYSTVSHDSDSFISGNKNDNRLETEFGNISIESSSKDYSQRFISTTPRILESEYARNEIIQMPLRVTPTALRFEAIEPGVLYVMTFSIQNATKTSQRIRISAPHTNHFALNYIPAGALAAGLDLRAEIECQLPLSSKEMIFTDKIIVSMGPHHVELPLFACRAGPDIIFNSVLNFGLIVENVPSTKRMTFRNRGVETGIVSVVFPDQTFFRATPSTFELPPQTEQIVSFRAESSVLGPLREIVMVHIEGTPDPMSIDLSAQVVVQKISLINAGEGGLLENLDFGYVFFGESRTTDALLVNNGPTPLAFVVSYENDEGQQSGAAGKADDRNRSVLITPSEGVLKAYSQYPVVIKYQPKVPNPSKGFTSVYLKDFREATVVASKPTIEIPETGQRLDLNISGAACLPDYHISPQILRFGKCAVYERRDILVTFSNNSNAPMNLQFNEVAHFKISPTKFLVQGGQAKTLVATFMPTQMGKFKNKFHLTIENGVSTAEIKVIGESNNLGAKKNLIGGPNSLPTDFKKSHHFVDPKEVAAQRIADKNPVEKFLPTLRPYGIDVESADSLYKGHDSLIATMNETDIDFISKKTQNRTIYNDFLQKASGSRKDNLLKQQKKKIVALCGYDRSNPFGKDMGIERDLDEPELALPIANEPLWLASRTDDKDGARRVTFDENRLILKKFSPQPVSQSDIRDCASEISFEALKSIICSHKILNFGRITVNSVNFKNFAVCNTLQRSVLIELSDFDQELSQSKPTSQIVPAGSTAGFDIIFTCREEGKYHGSFNVHFNGHHSTKVAVSADLSPLELTVDKKLVKFAFLDSSLESSVEEDIVLSNPGNASAEFLWGSAPSFKCSPERGVIEPGQSSIVKITWSPTANNPCQADLGMHVIGGIEQVIKVVGDLKFGKCNFKEKNLNFGSVAVGTDYIYYCRIVNTGNSSTVFSFDDIPEAFGIEVEPKKAILLQSSSVVIKVSLCPLSQMKYESSFLNVSVRGGKPISLKLSGESIFPELRLAESAFDFGQIAIGSELVLPMSISNIGTITSTAVINLNHYPDFFVCLLKNFDISTIDSSVRYDIDDMKDFDGNNLRRIVSSDESDSSQISKSRSWSFSIKAGSTIFAALIFKPAVDKIFEFTLPLQVQGLRNNADFSREVLAHGMKSRISLSSFIIDFGDRNVARDPTSRMSFFEEVNLSNSDKHGMTFEILELDDSLSPIVSNASSPDDAAPVYFISPIKGELSPNGSTIIRVTFMPESNSSYQKRFGIFISNQFNPRIPYQTLLCKASGVYPRLSFGDIFSIVLPVVPLKVTSRAEVIVYNNGYDGLIVKYRVSPTIPVNLEFSFPDGLELGYSVDKIRVVISYRSDVAISFSGKIEFYDDNGERFPLEVCGCSDSCILTNSSFVKFYKDNYGFMSLDEQPVYFLSKEEMVLQKQREAQKKETQRKLRAAERLKISGDLGNKSLSESSQVVSKEPPLVPRETKQKTVGGFIANEGIDPHKEETNETFDVASAREISFLLKWLQSFSLRKSYNISSFPACILETDGDIVIDSIESLSGKKIFSAGFPSYDSKTQNKTSYLLSKYKEIILYLVKAGALISHINLAFFLDKPEYLAAMESDLRKLEGERVTPSMLVTRKKAWELKWSEMCSRAWAELLFQVIKVFVLSRITYSSYKSTPGVVVFDSDGREDETNDKSNKKRVQSKIPSELRSSNVYSQAEAVLLKWSLYHIQHSNKSENQVANKSLKSGNVKKLNDFELDFANCFALCQIIHSHVPESTNDGSSLHGFFGVDQTRKDEFFKLMKMALESYKINFDFNYEELFASSRTVCLLLLHFYLNLPSLIPKNTLEFKGKLGEPITKLIELRNSSKRRIAYKVHLEGDKDFSIRENQIILEPDMVYEFEVTLLARFSKKIYGRISFWGIRENGMAGTNLVFKLCSNIIGHKPIETIRKSLCLFDVETFNIDFYNPFPKECNFIVRVETQFSPSSLSAFLSTSKSKSKESKKQIVYKAGNKSEKEKSQDELDIENLFVEPVWALEEKFSIPYQGSRSLVMNVAPFKLGTYTTQVILIDNAYGEFCKEVIVDITIPKPEKLDFTCKQSSGNSINKIIKISSKNSNFEKCLAFVIETRLNASKRSKARTILQNLIASVVDEESGLSVYNAEMLSPYFKCNKEFDFVSEYMIGLLSNNSSSKKLTKIAKTYLDPNDNLTVQGSSNTLLLTLFPERPGVYSSKLIVFSKTNEADIRVIELTAIITAIDINPTIEFKGPARSKVDQDIPICNEGETDWHLNINILGQSFNGTKTLLVAKGTTEYYQISFIGQSVGTFEGSLSLKDPSSGENFNYKLLGVAEEPLAEDNLAFVCKARKREVCKIFVKNFGPQKSLVQNSKSGVADSRKQTLLQVQTDLPYVSGSPTFDPNENDGIYEMTVFSPVGGIITGSITFTDSISGAIIWYTIEVDVISPEAESVVEVEAMVRKATSLEILLETIGSIDPIVFDVIVEGEGLIGDTTYTLNYDSNTPYELLYSPLKSGHYNGSVRFVNEKVGEFWYRIIMHAIAAPATDLPCIECMLGLSESHQIIIENPLSVPINLLTNIIDTEHFSVKPESISIAPFGQALVDIIYRPSSIGDIRSSLISFEASDFGELVYIAYGQGLLPGIMKTVSITAQMNEMCSYMIPFYNPFFHPLSIDIVLVGENDLDSQKLDLIPENLDIFELLTKKSKNLVVASKSTFQIAINFKPKKLSQYKAFLEVRSTAAGRDLRWCFPISGIAEMGPSQRLSKITTRCKTSHMREIEIPLEGLKKIDVYNGEVLNIANFEYETVVTDIKYSKIVEQAFRLQIIDVIELESNSTADYALKCRILFEPLRVFTSAVDMRIIDRSRGHWKLIIELESTEQLPDDVIHLRALVGKSDKVCFSINNRFLGFSTFQAYFSGKASNQFTVTPSSGMLSSEGTQFIVTYTPTEYGLTQKATLIIITDDAQWSYDIRGSHPEHKINSADIKSKVISRR